jgi:hypothetical protein
LKPSWRVVPLKLRYSLVPILHRYGAERDKTIRCARHELGDSVVDHPGGLEADFERYRVIALRRRRHDDLAFDAHVVQIP